MRLIDCVTIGVIGKDSPEIADNYPCREEAGLRFFCQVVTGDTRFIINYPVLETMSVSEEELWRRAAENTAASCVIKPIGAVLAEAGYGIPIEEAPRVLVVSNEDICYGAGVIGCDAVRKRITEMVGENFYIIPSSVHEVLVMNADMCTREEVNAMICDVNSMPDCIDELTKLADGAFVLTDGRLKVA